MRERAADRAEALLDEAEGALDQGQADHALVRCDQALEIAPDHPGAHFVRGDALRTLGRLVEAAEAYRLAALGRPDHAASWSSLGVTTFELLDYAAARRATSRAIREDPQNPEAWWVRSLLRERAGDDAGSLRAVTHAHWFDPEGFPIPPRLTGDEIEELVSDGLRYLHPKITEYLSQVAITIEDVPPDEVLRSYDPPASPLDLLGWFSGSSILERRDQDPWSQVPSVIVLFRRNIERHSADRDELIDQLRITLFHEIGHFLGLEEEDLEERGLD